jgi:DNA-binding transcriptional LysR family regulator
MRFDLTDLRLFIGIIERGSISKGAVQANMALASASARISGMEAELGTALLDRGPRGVVPTGAGRALVHHARTVTMQIERMRGDLRVFSSGLKGDIKVLSNTASLVAILPDALRVFLAAHRGVNVEVEERTSVDIAHAVEDGRAEIGLLSDGAETGRLESKTLAVDRLVVVMPREHALAARDTLAFAELLNEPFVGPGAGALHDHVSHHAAQCGCRLQYRVRLRSLESIAGLVEAGIGIAILPVVAIERRRTAALAVIPLSDAWATRRLLVCVRDSASLSAHARLLLHELERQAIVRAGHPRAEDP